MSDTYFVMTGAMRWEPLRARNEAGARRAAEKRYPALIYGAAAIGVMRHGTTRIVTIMARKPEKKERASWYRTVISEIPEAARRILENVKPDTNKG